MLSNCLDNYIGIRGLCSDTLPESGLYINDLQSVSLKMLANIADSEQKDFLGVFNEVTTRALNEFESDVMNRSQKFFRTNIQIENDKTGTFKEPYEVVSSSAEFKGVGIELRDNISNYLSIYINTVQIYLDGVGTKSILIYNTLDGVLMDTVTFEGVVGMNRVNINKSYPTYGQNTNIFICYDATATNSISVDNIDYSDAAIIRGAKVSTGSSVIDSNLVYDGDSYGLVVDYNIKCDISEFICSSRDAFKFALWYKFGACLMFERLNSDRLNKFTLNKSPLEIKEIYKFYDNKYTEIMESVMSNLNSNEDTVCFSCNRQRNYRYLKP
tara:strand:- start:1104 stop:2084 length:981 start_codon:yes stop_codon:yes gene_type:complete